MLYRKILVIPLYIIAANASPYPQRIVNDNLAAAQNFQSEIKSGKYLPELYSGESGKYGDTKPVKSGTFQGTQLETPKYIASNGGESLGGTFLSPGIVPAQNVKSEGEQVSGSQLVALTSDIYTGSHVLDSIDYINDRIEPIQDNTQPNKGQEDRLSELATLKVQKSSIATTSANLHQGAKLNSDTYWQYTGDGSIDAGWPAKDRWISFESMFDTNKDAMSHSCALFDAQVLESDSESEIKAIYDSILRIAHESLVDPRFILAILMQESFGCVRVPTTSYGHRNPGLMQAHNGDGTCNDNGHVQTPCPSTVINAMIYDGTMGTDDGDGLVQYINKAPGEDVSVFYRAARMYNSGSIDPSGDLAKGIATHCYASDIANRLTGWVRGDGCTFDG